mmetsp:Transcript_25721/g.56399  ORF Transcript_25721/g.56399 Transcript_25721/m.56399 type:complete len:84 (-) Transcript_25721:104-355(-)
MERGATRALRADCVRACTASGLAWPGERDRRKRHAAAVSSAAALSGKQVTEHERHALTLEGYVNERESGSVRLGLLSQVQLNR